MSIDAPISLYIYYIDHIFFWGQFQKRHTVIRACLFWWRHLRVPSLKRFECYSFDSAYWPWKIWEGLFVSVKDDYSEKEFVIGNIYRPPYNNNNEDNVNTFISELNPIIGKLNDNNRNILIAGDFNINLLHINMCNKEHFGNFLDMMLGYSLFPKITHPTRLGENSCSLIDDIFCTLSPSIIHSNAGILYSRISDHFPCYISIRPNKFKLGDHPKYVKQRIKSPQAYDAIFKKPHGSQHCRFLTFKSLLRSKRKL